MPYRGCRRGLLYFNKCRSWVRQSGFKNLNGRESVGFVDAGSSCADFGRTAGCRRWQSIRSRNAERRDELPRDISYKPLRRRSSVVGSRQSPLDGLMPKFHQMSERSVRRVSTLCQFLARPKSTLIAWYSAVGALRALHCTLQLLPKII